MTAPTIYYSRDHAQNGPGRFARSRHARGRINPARRTAPQRRHPSSSLRIAAHSPQSNRPRRDHPSLPAANAPPSRHRAGDAHRAFPIAPTPRGFVQSGFDEVADHSHRTAGVGPRDLTEASRFKDWMNREALDSLDKEALIRLVLTQAETIAALNGGWRC